MLDKIIEVVKVENGKALKMKVRYYKDVLNIKVFTTDKKNYNGILKIEGNYILVLGYNYFNELDDTLLEILVAYYIIRSNKLNVMTSKMEEKVIDKILINIYGYTNTINLYKYILKADNITEELRDILIYKIDSIENKVGNNDNIMIYTDYLIGMANTSKLLHVMEMSR